MTKDIEQLPVNITVSFVRGDDFVFDVKVKDGSGSNIDFTSWSNEKIQVRTTEDKGFELLDEYKGSSLATTSSGRVKCIFPSNDTKKWQDRNIVFEMDGEDGNGVKRSIIRGYIELVDGVSK